MANFTGGPQSAFPQAIVERAIALQKQGGHEGAIKRYKRVLKKAPGHSRILNMCALSTAETGHLDAAAKMLKKAVAGDPVPVFADGRVNLGMILQKSEDTRISIAYDAVPRG